ncbi:hypothetical protein A3759_15995 [Thalassolituus sp. HI0120]|nr:hypothetical protein A3759_15995 [Thalassolituus sp. HI0120]
MSNNSVWGNFYLILMAAWRQRYVILIPVMILPVLGGVIGTTQGKVYDTHTTILVQETSKLNPFLEDLSVSTNLKERIAALDTLLHSRHVLTSVAEELQLFKEGIGQAEKDRIIRQLSSGIGLNQRGKDLVQISYRAGVPDKMKRTLEVVSKYFVDQLLAPERSSIAKSEEFIKAQIEEQKAQLLISEQALSDFKHKNAASLPAFHGGNVKRLRELRQLLAAKNVELSGATAELSSMDKQLTSTNPVVGALEKRIVGLTGELELLRSRYTDRHSKVVHAQRQLVQLRKKRNYLMEKTATLTPEQVERLWNLAMSSTNNGEARGVASMADQSRVSTLLVSQLQDIQKSKTKEQRLKQEISSIESQIRRMDIQVRSFATVERELTELERDLDTRKKLYNEFLKRYEMAKVTGSLGKFEEKNRIKIIDQPFTPSAPSNIPALIFVLAGIIGGLGLGTGLALLFELLDTTLRRSDQLQKMTNAPVLSRIPKLKPLTISDTVFDD